MLFFQFYFFFLLSNIIGSVLYSWSLWFLCKPEVLLPLASVVFPWAMGDTQKVITEHNVINYSELALELSSLAMRFSKRVGPQHSAWGYVPLSSLSLDAENHFNSSICLVTGANRYWVCLPAAVAAEVKKETRNIYPWWSNAVICVLKKCTDEEENHLNRSSIRSGQR